MMKAISNRAFLKHTRRGVASLYVVIFVAIVLGVITLSFVRLILAEASKTTSADLSQSAYDSALAGVEDAKAAMIKYYNCLAENPSFTYDPNFTFNPDGVLTCEEILHSMHKFMLHFDDNYSCDAVGVVLGRNGNDGQTGEVVIKETAEQDSRMAQAYTCVKVTDKTDDYRSTLSLQNSVRVIPIQAETATVTGIRLSWYSSNNGVNFNFANQHNFPSLSGANAATPPTITLQLIQAGNTFRLSDFDIRGSHGTNQGLLALVPTTPEDSTGGNYFTRDIFMAANDKKDNYKNKIKCGSADTEFACTAAFQLPFVYDTPQLPPANTLSPSRFLVISLPYGQPTTDFAVELCTDSDGRCHDNNNNPTTTRFSRAQVAVDSTGRANDLFRRVEARFEFTDLYFPYPNFAIHLSGTDDTLSKNFWVTQNCWPDPNNPSNKCQNSGNI